MHASDMASDVSANIAYSWEQNAAPITTVELIAAVGMLRFCKIDFEGLESDVLNGSSPDACFEFASGFLNRTRTALTRLSLLGVSEFDLSFGAFYERHLTAWADLEMIDNELAAFDGVAIVDVYASLANRGPQPPRRAAMIPRSSVTPVLGSDAYLPTTLDKVATLRAEPRNAPSPGAPKLSGRAACISGFRGAPLLDSRCIGPQAGSLIPKRAT